jgi:putative ABC transport system substrate-binding protein
MRRRDFIKGIVGSTAAWPLHARAQQPALPVVALINLRSAEASMRLADAFRKGLDEAGYVEGRNVTVEYDWLDGRFDRLSSVMADVVRQRVAVIATPGGNYASQAAKAATTTIPIVIRRQRRPGQIGPCRQPCSAGRKCDRP